MPFPLVAVAAGAAARALPMIAGAVGRGAAAGATRMGASPGVARLAGGVAEGQTIRSGVGLINKATGHGDGGSEPAPMVRESRAQNFRYGSGPW